MVITLGRLTAVVVDASALVEYLCRTDLGFQVATILEEPDTSIHTPTTCDIDFCAGLSALDRADAEAVLALYVNLPVVRHEHHSGLPRLLELLGRFSPYEAPYVALAERLDATLVTCDGRLTRRVQEHLALNVVGVTG